MIFHIYVTFWFYSTITHLLLRIFFLKQQNESKTHKFNNELLMGTFNFKMLFRILKLKQSNNFVPKY